MIQNEIQGNEKRSALGLLADKLAQELGTPLNTLSGHIELLKNDLSDSPLAEHSTTLEQANARLEILSEQIQRIEKVLTKALHETRTPERIRERTNLYALLENVLTILSPRIESLRIRVQTSFPPQPVIMRARPSDWEQLYLQLLINAIDGLAASQQRKEQSANEPSQDSGRILILVRIVEKEGQPWVSLVVEDNGIGIEKERLASIFEPFHTSKEAELGTGLGLSICKDLVEKYGGTISVESRANEWTKVKAILPLHQTP